MAQDKEETGARMLNTRYGKVILTVIAGFLTFGSPYLVYLMSNALDIGWFISIGSGGILFVIGLVLIWYLIRKKVIA
jgi:uncharacterized membrane protein SpoIIM required for sporulation